MIELIVYPKSNNKRLINPSPFCSKTEIFLNLANIDYKLTEFNGDPSKFPNKKLPVIKDDTQIIPDSSLIQDFLIKKFSIDLDSHLTPSLKAQGFAFSKMLEEFFYWSLLHERWFIDKNWEKLKADYFGHIPGLMRGFVTNMIRKSTKKSAIGHGMSRHTDEHVLKFGRDCIQAISDFLADKPFFLGEQISSYDVTVYAFISSILHSDYGQVLREEATKHPNLIAYDERVYGKVFAE